MLRSIRSTTTYIAMSLLLLGITALAQNGRLTDSPGGKPGVRAVPSKEQKRALGTLVQLFELSRNSQDQVFRIEAEADIADALWRHDPKRARSYFVDAFRAIDSIKREEQDTVGTATTPPTAYSVKSELYRRIGILISSHDPRLAKGLIDELPKSPHRDSIDRSTLYPGMATAALGTDPQRAVEMARAGLESGITAAFINSLIAIRSIQPQLADGLFYESLAVAAHDVDHFSNDLRLLASYVFGSGGAGNEDGNDTTGGPLTPTTSDMGLITDFLNFALQTSLAIHGKSGVRSAPGLMSYVPLMQLLPYYQLYLPDTAAAITAAFNQLVAAVPDPQKRTLLVNLIARPSVDRVIQAGNSLVKTDQKDLLYERAALQASSRGDFERALTIAESISDERMRQKSKATAYVEAATRALGEGNINAACKYAIEIPELLQKSRVFAQIIRTLSGQKELVRANDVLDVAERQITLADDSPEKVRSLLLLSSVALSIDQVRATTILQLAVVGINHSDFSNKSHKTEASASNIQEKSAAPGKVDAAKSLSFHQSFGILAVVDFETALSLAQSIAEMEISIRAQIAACRGVLQTNSQGNQEINKRKKPRETSGSRITNWPVS